MRLATWNVNSVTARQPRLLDWLRTVSPDVVCLQETKVPDGAFPAAPLEELGYQVACNGQGRWNGVAVCSRAGLEDITRDLPFRGPPEMEGRVIAANCGGVRVWSIYAPNGRSLDSPHFGYKLEWFQSLTELVAAELTGAKPPLAICGDFNVAPSDRDVWDPTAFIGATHVSAPERAAVQRLLDLGFQDVQPRALKGEPFTYWDYRAGMFHKGQGMRIDLVLLQQTLAGSLGDAYVDRNARKGPAPSDHAPVVVDVDVTR